MSTTQVISIAKSEFQPLPRPHSIAIRLQITLNHLSRALTYHSRTIWLFTRSDLKTIVIPSTLFASTYTASKLVSNPSSTSHPSLASLLTSLLLTIFWIWLNLLPFTIENQRQPDSILEDTVNKPWRPLAAGRLSPRNAAFLAVFSYSTAILVSAALGATVPCLALIVLGTMYNRLKNGLIARNALNGCGYICFTAGALRVMTRMAGLEGAVGDWEILPWVLMIGAVVTSSIHMLDLPDQIGDRARGRRTIPLVFGDGVARWSVVTAVGFWSVCCSMFWGLNAVNSLVLMALGTVVIARTLGRRTVKEDKKTSLLYNVWIAGLFCLPLLKSMQVA